MTAPLTVGDLRPSVVAFALAMEAKLRANAHKGNRAAWREDHPRDLLLRVYEETAELEHELALLSHGGALDADSRARIRAEAADVGNMVMMVADACGAFAELAEGDE